jgi:hypothetical protein
MADAFGSKIADEPQPLTYSKYDPWCPGFVAQVLLVPKGRMPASGTLLALAGSRKLIADGVEAGLAWKNLVTPHDRK